MLSTLLGSAIITTKSHMKSNKNDNIKPKFLGCRCYVPFKNSKNSKQAMLSNTSISIMACAQAFLYLKASTKSKPKTITA